MSCLTILKLLTLSLVLTDVRISTLDEVTVQGQLVRLEDSEIVVASATGAETSVALANVIDVRFGNSDEPPAPKQSNVQFVQLLDGSALLVSDIEATAEFVTAGSAESKSLRIPRSAVRATRLQTLEEDWEPQWVAFLQRNNNKDLLIVAKRDGSGLDFLAGVVSAVGAEEVPFLLDGDEIPVPRARVFGIVFAKQDPKASVLNGSIRLSLTDGTQLMASKLSLAGETLNVDTSWGQSLDVSMDRLAAIDFSSGRIHFLSDLEPLSEQYFGLDPPGREWGPLFEEDRATRTGMSRQWKMSRDSFPNSGRPPLTLRGKQYRKGLCIFPSARVEYALDGRYSSLQAVVGVDDEVAFSQLAGKPPSVVELRVESDGDEVFRKLVTAPEEPVELKLDLKGVTTLAIIVDFGDESSTCDYLDIANAKLFVDTSAK